MYATQTVATKKIDLPVLKIQPARLFDLLLCADQHPYDREGFKECVLTLFPGRAEKSVFRGMAIPTLRRLGLIIGYEDLIRLSSDGFVILKARDISTEQGLRALRAYLLEYESRRGWGIIDGLIGTAHDKHSLVSDLVGAIEAPSSRQASERLRDWLGYLCFSSLLSCNGVLSVVQRNFDLAKKDIDPMPKASYFQRYFLDAYRLTSESHRGASAVEIDEVRRAVAKKALEKKNAIITSCQFDHLLRSSVEAVTNRYMISFGRSMGADEGLLEFRDKYYKTVSIRFAH
jgi:hypothetical protein